jgi:hypothetical protein
MYNGKEVTYGLINSSETGSRWLDRNLGAPNTPTAYNDYANLGDLFQWGRAADGHQLVVRTADTDNAFHGASSAVNASVSDLSSTDTPLGHGFILSSADPFDWRSSINNNLWQGVNGTNNPCPPGWRIPTIDEWKAEKLVDDQSSNFVKLNLTNTGLRYPDAGNFSATNGSGRYWSSTVDASLVSSVTSDGTLYISSDYRGSALACRCIKDESN